MIATLLVLIAQPASQPASQPAQLTPGGTGRDVTGSVTWILELDEAALRVQESWSLTNESGKLVSKQYLRFQLPPGTRKLQLPEDVSGFAGADDASEIYATEDMASGTKSFSAGHMLDFQGGSSVVRRTVPVQTAGARLIVENIAGLEVTSSHVFNERISDLNGLEFRVMQFAPIEAGTTVEVRLEGLPSRSVWPRRVATALSVSILGWLLFSLQKPKEKIDSKLGPLSAQARRDQIVKAIEILERDLAEEKINEKRYERRHQELMYELASVLEEIELQRNPPAA